VLGQPHHVALALAQRWQRQREHGEPVVEVLPEAPGRDGGAQVLVGGGDDPDVDGLVARATEPPHRALLDHLQQLGLHRLRQQPNLVQEDRAAMRRLEQPLLGAPRVGEGAALEAEHLRFEQRVRDGGAVDVDEGPLGARSRPVQRASQEPLARARLSLDEDGRQPPRIALTLQQALDLVAHRLDPAAVAEQILERFHSGILLSGRSIRCSTLDHRHRVAGW
jgi:hypothetical protein